MEMHTIQPTKWWLPNRNAIYCNAMSMTLKLFSSFVCCSLFYLDDDKVGTLDAILGTAYCRTQMYLSKQMAQLRPEITMPMFSGMLCTKFWIESILRTRKKEKKKRLPRPFFVNIFSLIKLFAIFIFKSCLITFIKEKKIVQKRNKNVDI